MKTGNRRLVGSAVAFVAVFTATVLWHELGHGVAAKALGYLPVVYSGREDDPATTTRDSVLIAAAGPLLSLVTGVVLLVLARRQPRGFRTGSLLLTWAGLLGVETFTGYLLTAPFFAGGDVGRILSELGAPFAVALAVMALGIAGVVGVAWIAVAAFHRLAPEQPARPTDLRLFLRQTAVLPWLIGTVVLLVASLPLDSPFGPLAVGTSGLFTLVAMGLTARRFPGLVELGPRRNGGRLAVLVVLALALLLLDRLVFGPGVAL